MFLIKSNDIVIGEGWPIGFGTQNKYGTVEEGNFVLKYNFVQKKVFCV